MSGFDSIRVGYPGSKLGFGFRAEPDPMRRSWAEFARRKVATFNPVINHAATDVQALGYFPDGQFLGLF